MSELAHTEWVLESQSKPSWKLNGVRGESQSRGDHKVHISRGHRPGNRVQTQWLLCPVTHEDEGSFGEPQLQAFGWFAKGHLGADAYELLSAEQCECRALVAFDLSYFYPLLLYCHHHRQWKICREGGPASFPSQPTPQLRWEV